VVNRVMRYVTAMAIVPVVRQVKPGRLFTLASMLGRLIYFLAPDRREGTLENLRRFFRDEKSEREIKTIARHSSASLLMGVFENLHFRHALEEPRRMSSLDATFGEIQFCMKEAKAIHDRSGGCVFVTAHIGGYTILPYIFSLVKIPLTIPINPTRDESLQRRFCPLNVERSLQGEIFVAKKNSLEPLLSALQQGRSVGILADQRPTGGVTFDSQHMSVLTSPIPALLALRCKRPIVVGACYRRHGRDSYEVKLCEPIWPDLSADETTEIRRLTVDLDAALTVLVRAQPEQYLWMHDRWKPHRLRKARSVTQMSTDNS